MTVEESPPQWLHEPMATRLLNVVLDRLDGRKRPVQRLQLRVDSQLLPELYDSPDEQDFGWELLKEMQARRIFKINQPRGWRRGDEVAKLRLDFQLSCEDLLRHWLQRPQNLSKQRWLAAIETHRHQFPGVTGDLAAKEIKIPGRTAAEVVRGFTRIGSFLNGPISLRRLSARCFWGNSKVLDKRRHIVESLYSGRVVQVRPLLLSAYLPQRPRGVLVIENQDTFCYLQQDGLAAAEDLVLVYIQGFKGTAKRIREPGGACFSYGGDNSHRVAFESYWLKMRDYPQWPVFFWGDLDDAGMAILAGLKASFPAIDAWRPGYEPMLAALAGGDGHAPAEAGKDLQVPVAATGCRFADNRLIPALRQYGAYVDQEYVI